MSASPKYVCFRRYMMEPSHSIVVHQMSAASNFIILKDFAVAHRGERFSRDRRRRIFFVSCRVLCSIVKVFSILVRWWTLKGIILKCYSVL